MTRIAGIADLHIGAAHLTNLGDQERALMHVTEELVDRKVEVLLIGGDVFHTNRPTPAAIAVAGRFFVALQRAGIQSVIAKGNHDPDAAEILQWFPGAVAVPSTPTVLRLPQGIDCAVLPWLIDQNVRAAGGGALSKEEVAAQLTFAARSILAGFRAQRRPGVPMVLVTHATIAGSETSTGWSMGFTPGPNWIIPVEDLAEFDLVIAGHIHKRQKPADNIEVPGSLLPLDFSETEERGIVVADLPDVAGWEFVPIPTPKVVTIDVSGVEQLQELIEA